MSADKILLVFIYAVSIAAVLITLFLIAWKIIYPFAKYRKMYVGKDKVTKHIVTLSNMELSCDNKKIDIMTLFKRVKNNQEKSSTKKNIKNQENVPTSNGTSQYFYNNKLIIVSKDVFGNWYFNNEMLNFLFKNQHLLSQSQQQSRDMGNENIFKE